MTFPVDIALGVILIAGTAGLYAAKVISEETAAMLAGFGVLLIRSGHVDKTKTTQLKQQTRKLEEQTEIMKDREAIDARERRLGR